MYNTLCDLDHTYLQHSLCSWAAFRYSYTYFPFTREEERFAFVPPVIWNVLSLFKCSVLALDQVYPCSMSNAHLCLLCADAAQSHDAHVLLTCAPVLFLLWIVCVHTAHHALSRHTQDEDTHVYACSWKTCKLVEKFKCWVIVWMETLKVLGWIIVLVMETCCAHLQKCSTEV